MTQGLAKADVDLIVSDLFGGSVPSRMTAAEAARELAAATMFAREPDPRAVAARERAEAQQEAFRYVAPWRAAAPWEAYDELAEAEERLASLWSTRRGQTIERARGLVTQLLRDAWANAEPGSDRYAAVVAERDHYTQYLQAQTPLVTLATESAAGGSGVREPSEAGAAAAITRLFTRDGKGD